MATEQNPVAESVLKVGAGSIRQKLSFFILAIILVVVLVFGYASYIGVRKAAARAAHERLKALSGQLSIALRPDTLLQVMPSRRLAERPAVKQFLVSGKQDSVEVIQSLLDGLRYDSTYLNTYLLTGDRRIVLQGKGNPVPNILLDSAFLQESAHQRIWIGKLFAVSDTVVYPIVIKIKDNDGVIGYLVRWRRLYATTQSLKMLSSLMGQVALYIGNVNDTLWTDMRVPGHVPDLGKPTSDSVYTYERREGGMIASIMPMPGTPWLLSVEIATDLVYLPAYRFLYWILLAAVVLLVIGVVAAILLSRNISRPLVSLTAAAARMAEGDFELDDTTTLLERKDEIGRLARVFAVMNRKINASKIELKQLNQSLEQLVAERTQQLQLVNEELESFSYSVSHDLRAPLRAINGYSHLLSEDHSLHTNDETRNYLKIIQANAKSMGTLIDDLLAFSRLGRKEMQTVPVNVKQMVEDVIHDISQSVEHKAAIVVHELEPAVADSGLLKQVWQNLISNAIKYSSKKTIPEIEIGSFRNDEEVVYYVKDNGAGFDMQYVNKLFGVFQRLHYADEFEGTGIGLALVHRIVTRHGGRVWAEGETGRGASFFFTLQ